MDEYIKREAAIKSLLNDCLGQVNSSREDAADCIFWLDTADVAPVVHGRWESVKNPQWPAYSHDKCSLCGWWNTKNALCYDGHKKPGHALNYCPNCGAKMDGGADDES